jgi:threonine dehydrogenase-like Zn-dependent dehydrogenase
MTRVNNCIPGRVVVMIGAGSQSTYAVQCAQSMGARKIIVVNRGAERLHRVLRDFNAGNVVGIPWNAEVVKRVFEECRPFNEPHFVMMNAPCEEGYRLATQLAGYNTVLDMHAGLKTAAGKPRIAHEIDLNNDIHYKLQCYQATHGSSMHGIRLAHDLLNNRRLPMIGGMTGETERFGPAHLLDAIHRAAASDSLKVIVDWDQST